MSNIVFLRFVRSNLDIERKKDILLQCFVLHLFNSVCFAWNCSLLFYGLGDLGGGCSARVVATAMLRWGGVLLLLLALLEDRLFVSGGPEGHHFAVAGLTVRGGPEPFQALVEGGPWLDGVLWLLLLLLGRPLPVRGWANRRRCVKLGGWFVGRWESRTEGGTVAIPASEKGVVITTRLVSRLLCVRIGAIFQLVEFFVSLLSLSQLPSLFLYLRLDTNTLGHSCDTSRSSTGERLILRVLGEYFLSLTN